MHTIIPQPQTVTPAGSGEFVLGPQTVIYVPDGDADALRIGRYLSAVIGIAAAPEPPRVQPARSDAPGGAIHLRRAPPPAGGQKAEG